MLVGILGRGRRHRLQALRLAVHAVAFSVPPPLERHGSVVVERRSPQHAAVRHHAFLDLQRFLRMTVGRATAQMRDAQVTGIHEPDEFRRFVVE